MGGKIWVESKVNKGSMFCFTVRFQRGRDTAASFEPSSAVLRLFPSGITVQDIEDFSCNGIRVLVAEDSVTNQELMQIYLDSFGCQGDFVSNGQEALEKARQNEYDICFMDVEMPIVNGLEATKAIHQTIPSEHLPIVALTGASWEEEKSRCLGAGMVDYLMKPFDVLELKGLILRHTKLYERILEQTKG